MPQNIFNKISFFLIVFSALFLSACSNETSDLGTNIDLNKKISPSIMPTTATSQTTISPSIAKTPNDEAIVAISTKDGEIVLKLYQKETPNTVKNFINKTNSDFYNGLTFHRVIPGFMAQGGDPTGTGMGGGSQKSELNSIPFKRGSVGLARTPQSKDISNDSQFFICFTTEGCQHLTADYVNFGEVISGFEVLDKIQQGDKIISISSKTK